MNAYANVAQLKARLDLADDATEDALLCALLEAVSRQVDGYCGRIFYVETATLLFDGDGAKELWLQDEVRIRDLLSVTTLKFDDDQDGDFDETLASTDYLLRPSNAGRYSYVLIHPEGDYGAFPKGLETVQIVGSWGYRDQTVDSGADVGTGGIDDSATTLPLTGRDLVGIGDTIRIGTEDMYITDMSSYNKATVKRAVNGTTAAVHAADASVSVYEYPDVVEPVIMQAARLYKRKDSAYARVLGGAEGATMVVHRGLDDDVKELLVQHRALRGVL